MQPYAFGEVVVVLDCADLDRAAAFWTEALHYRRYGNDSAGPYVSLHPPTDGSPELLLQRVPEPKTSKSRLHIDLRTPDMAAEVDRLLAAGATLLTRDPIEEDGWRWHILADPDGNELCVLQRPNG